MHGLDTDDAIHLDPAKLSQKQLLERQGKLGEFLNYWHLDPRLRDEVKCIPADKNLRTSSNLS